MKSKNGSRKNLKLFVSSFLAILLIFLLSFPVEFCRAVGSPSFWTSRYYVMGLIDQGSTDAGLKGRSYEFAISPPPNGRRW
jgi:hypothetical protein